MTLIDLLLLLAALVNTDVDRVHHIDALPMIDPSIAAHPAALRALPPSYMGVTCLAGTAPGTPDYYVPTAESVCVDAQPGEVRLSYALDPQVALHVLLHETGHLMFGISEQAAEGFACSTYPVQMVVSSWRCDPATRTVTQIDSGWLLP